MTIVDWLILAFALLMALQGYARGFLVGVMALAGFVGGALVGSHLAPLVLSKGDHSPYAPILALGGALLGGSLLGGIFEGVARRVRRLLWFPPFRIVDGLAGAALTACLGLGIAWITGTVLLQGASGFHLSASIRRDLQHSVILKALNRTLPPSGSILNALARIDPLPSVNGRLAEVAAPDPAIVNAGGVDRAGPSVVRVIGSACEYGLEGSGWVAGRGLVVTNAHVVAGETNTLVQVGGRGLGLRATVRVFDPHNDIAILSVPGLAATALTLETNPPTSASGESGAILGYPLNGGFNRQPGRLGETQFTATQNAYGDPTVREISSLRGLVRPGNSGGPMVDASGQVIGTVFAEITNAPEGEPGGFAVPDAVVRAELTKARSAHRAVSTRSCAD
jgi:S1-C subfamily serine protease